MTSHLPSVLLFSLCRHLIYGPVTQAERHLFLRGNVILTELTGTRTCGVTLFVDPDKPQRSPAAQSTKFPSGGGFQYFSASRSLLFRFWSTAPRPTYCKLHCEGATEKLCSQQENRASPALCPTPPDSDVLCDSFPPFTGSLFVFARLMTSRLSSSHTLRMSQSAEVTRRVRHLLIKLVKRCSLGLHLNDTKKENQKTMTVWWIFFFRGGVLNDKCHNLFPWKISWKWALVLWPFLLSHLQLPLRKPKQVFSCTHWESLSHF